APRPHGGIEPLRAARRMIRRRTNGRNGSVAVAMAAVVLLAAGCSGGAQPRTTGSSVAPPATPAPRATGLRSPPSGGGSGPGTTGPVADVRHRIERFMTAPHGTVSLNWVHVAGAKLASLQDDFEAHLAQAGPFRGGDQCIEKAAAAEALVGTKLGP